MTGFVYAIERDDGLIKIGYSAAPRARLAALRCQQKMALQPLGVKPNATHADERLLHRLLAAARDHGEWFRPTGPVQRVVAAMQPWPEAIKRGEERAEQVATARPLLDAKAAMLRSSITGVSRVEALLLYAEAEAAA